MRFYYNHNNDTLYFIDEIYKNKLTNRKSADIILERGYTDFEITCDSAEPKSINDFRDFGIPARGAIKGPGSVEYSMKWLQGRKIVIDPKRTPGVHKEFTKYEYERDKDGNIISGYPDKDNHLIDATRYGSEKLWRRRGSSA